MKAGWKQVVGGVGLAKSLSLGLGLGLGLGIWALVRWVGRKGEEQGHACLHAGKQAVRVR